MKHRPTIVLTGGGSGGHITPLLSLAHELKRLAPNTRIVYIGLKNDKLAGLKSRYSVFDEVSVVPAGKFRRYHGDSFLSHLFDVKTLLLNIRDIFRVIAGTITARSLLRRYNPDVIFSKGSYVAVPVGIAAHWRGTPIVTHDSDATAGLANKIIGRWARVNATGMPSGDYPYPESQTRYTGIPIDERIVEVDKERQTQYKKQLGYTEDNLCLLVGGAGLGSQSINQKTVEIAPELLQRFPNLRLIHITGGTHEDDIKRRYQEILDKDDIQKVKVMGFTDEFYKYTGAADLIVTRAGATTIAELSAQAKAVILIPAPFLTGGQQLKNAEQLESGKAALILNNDVSADKLLDRVAKLLDSPLERRKLSVQLLKFARPAASTDLAKVVLSVMDWEPDGS